ncbi:MAG: hypothetical protein KC475_10920 [Cyanobacteria bacterium HKST-UBA03]|nr:hypothetical protein [Cyanobacteria bacterium HKST-UBA03]
MSAGPPTMPPLDGNGNNLPIVLPAQPSTTGSDTPVDTQPSLRVIPITRLPSSATPDMYSLLPDFRLSTTTASSGLTDMPFDLWTSGLSAHSMSDPNWYVGGLTMSNLAPTQMVLTPQQVELYRRAATARLQLQQQSLGLTTSSDTAAMNANQRRALLLQTELIEQQLLYTAMRNLANFHAERLEDLSRSRSELGQQAENQRQYNLAPLRDLFHSGRATSITPEKLYLYFQGLKAGRIPQNSTLSQADIQTMAPLLPYMALFETHMQQAVSQTAPVTQVTLQGESQPVLRLRDGDFPFLLPEHGQPTEDDIAEPSPSDLVIVGPQLRFRPLGPSPSDNPDGPIPVPVSVQDNNQLLRLFNPATLNTRRQLVIDPTQIHQVQENPGLLGQFSTQDLLTLDPNTLHTLSRLPGNHTNPNSPLGQIRLFGDTRQRGFGTEPTIGQPFDLLPRSFGQLPYNTNNPADLLLSGFDRQPRLLTLPTTRTEDPFAFSQGLPLTWPGAGLSFTGTGIPKFVSSTTHFTGSRLMEGTEATWQSNLTTLRQYQADRLGQFHYQGIDFHTLTDPQRQELLAMLQNNRDELRRHFCPPPGPVATAATNLDTIAPPGSFRRQWLDQISQGDYNWLPAVLSNDMDTQTLTRFVALVTHDPFAAPPPVDPNDYSPPPVAPPNPMLDQVLAAQHTLAQSGASQADISNALAPIYAQLNQRYTDLTTTLQETFGANTTGRQALDDFQADWAEFLERAKALGYTPAEGGSEPQLVLSDPKTLLALSLSHACQNEPQPTADTLAQELAALQQRWQQLDSFYRFSRLNTNLQGFDGTRNLYSRLLQPAVAADNQAAFARFEAQMTSDMPTHLAVAEAGQVDTALIPESRTNRIGLPTALSRFSVDLATPPESFAKTDNGVLTYTRRWSQPSALGEIEGDIENESVQQAWQTAFYKEILGYNTYNPDTCYALQGILTDPAKASQLHTLLTSNTLNADTLGTVLGGTATPELLSALEAQKAFYTAVTTTGQQAEQQRVASALVSLAGYAVQNNFPAGVSGAYYVMQQYPQDMSYMAHTSSLDASPETVSDQGQTTAEWHADEQRYRQMPVVMVSPNDPNNDMMVSSGSSTFYATGTNQPIPSALASVTGAWSSYVPQSVGSTASYTGYSSSYEPTYTYNSGYSSNYGSGYSKGYDYGYGYSSGYDASYLVSSSMFNGGEVTDPYWGYYGNTSYTGGSSWASSGSGSYSDNYRGQTAASSFVI